MLRFLAKTTIGVLANAVGLLAASIILEDFQIDGVSFAVAVLIYSAAIIILSPLILKIALQNANYLVGGIALVSIFVALLITNFISEGISISGPTTWVLATLIVWIFSILGNILLPLVLFKKALGNIKEDKAEKATE